MSAKVVDGFYYNTNTDVEQAGNKNNKEEKIFQYEMHFLGHVIMAFLATLCNIFLGLYGMAVVEIQNLTKDDIIVSLSGRQATDRVNIFDEEDIWNWDLHIIRSGEGQFFTMSIGSDFSSRALFMLNGVGLIARKSCFTFKSAVIKMKMKEREHKLEFKSKRVGIIVPKESFIKMEESGAFKEYRENKNEDEKVYVWNKKYASPDDMFAYAVSYDHLTDEKIAKNVAHMKQRTKGAHLTDSERDCIRGCIKVGAITSAAEGNEKAELINLCEENCEDWKAGCENWGLPEMIEDLEKSEKEFLKKVFLLSGLFLYAFEYSISRKEKIDINTLYTTDDIVTCDIFDEKFFDAIGREIFQIKFDDEYIPSDDESKKHFDAKDAMDIVLRAGYHDIVKKLAERIRDAYNEIGLLIIECLKPDVELLNVIVLALAALTINILNGGKSSPAGAPGPHWWGSGYKRDRNHGLLKEVKFKDVDKQEPIMKIVDGVEVQEKGPVDVLEHSIVMEDNKQKDVYRSSGAFYNDEMLRGATPFLVTALMNLAVLMGEDVNNMGWAEMFVFCTSEGYLCCFIFSLICVIETTSRGKTGDYPLANLRDIPWLGEIGARAITTLCQVLCICSILVVNYTIYFIPSKTRVIAVGFFVFYGGILLRFRSQEPGMVAVAWFKSNIRFVLYPVLYLLSSREFSANLLKWWRLCDRMHKLSENYFVNYINSWLYMLIFFSACALSLLIQLEIIIAPSI